MALTAKEELKILSGEISPSSPLIDFVHQIAMSEGVSFYSGYKAFDGTTEIEAQAYLNKILNIIGNVFRVDGKTVNSLVKLIVSLIGDSNNTYSQVDNATDTQLEAFISTNMLRTFELLSGVLKSEKTAYEAL